MKKEIQKKEEKNKKECQKSNVLFSVFIRQLHTLKIQ